jgi:hypothetical protein
MHAGTLAMADDLIQDLEFQRTPGALMDEEAR